jgi:hypothetical protein
MLVFAMYTLPVVTVEETDAPILHEDLDINAIMQVNPSAICVQRLNDMVQDFISWGLL